MSADASTIHSLLGPKPTPSRYHRIDQIQMIASIVPATAADGMCHARSMSTTRAAPVQAISRADGNWRNCSDGGWRSEPQRGNKAENHYHRQVHDDDLERRWRPPDEQQRRRGNETDRQERHRCEHGALDGRVPSTRSRRHSCGARCPVRADAIRFSASAA